MQRSGGFKRGPYVRGVKILMSNVPGWDIVRIDDGEYEGFSLVDPEGNVWMETKVSREFSPGWGMLLEEAEALVETRRGLL